MLELVKTALRLSTDVYDDELQGYIQAGLRDLGIAGVETFDGDDDLIRTAVITYCRMHFGSPENYDQLKRSYDEQKAQLQVATGYTNWSTNNDKCECNAN